MKAPWYSKINWVAVAIFLPAALQLWQSSPLSTQYPNLALWIALVGSIAILAMRTFFTAEATTLATESTKRTARRQRRKDDAPVVVGNSGKVVAAPLLSNEGRSIDLPITVSDDPHPPAPAFNGVLEQFDFQDRRDDQSQT